MTTEAIFNAIADSLSGYLAYRHAQPVSRARDPFEVMELLGNGPGKFRVILMWGGDEPAGTEPTSGIVESRFIVTVSTNRGMPVVSGAMITAPPAGEVSLMDWVNDVSCLLRALDLDDELSEATSAKLRYGGCSVVEYEGARLDAYELRFSLFHALDQTTDRILQYLE